jgi:hypothetical protein
MTRPRRRLLVFTFASVGTLVATSLTALAGETCSDEVGGGSCGLNFLAWNLSSPIAIAAAGVLGAMIGFGVAFVFLLATKQQSRVPKS